MYWIIIKMYEPLQRADSAINTIQWLLVNAHLHEATYCLPQDKNLFWRACFMTYFHRKLVGRITSNWEGFMKPLQIKLYKSEYNIIYFRSFFMLGGPCSNMNITINKQFASTFNIFLINLQQSYQFHLMIYIGDYQNFTLVWTKGMLEESSTFEQYFGKNLKSNLNLLQICIGQKLTIPYHIKWKVPEN